LNLGTSIAYITELGDLRNLAPKPTPPCDYIPQGGVVRLRKSRGLNSSRRSSKPEEVFMERRSAPRKPVLMSGVIKFADITVNCLICDMSISGAAIEVSNPQDIPERFSVVFKGDDIPLPCYVVWRKADRIGVAFE
jgi:hypothetical protein